MKRCCLLLMVGALVLSAGAAMARPLARFEIDEPLGANFWNEWVTKSVTLELDKPADVEDLRLRATLPDDRKGGPQEELLPLQVYEKRGREWVMATGGVSDGQKVKLLFQTDLPKNATVKYELVRSEKSIDRSLTVSAGRLRSAPGLIRIRNRHFTLTFPKDKPFPGIATPYRPTPELPAHWPDGVKVTDVKDTLVEDGPARAILRREFSFADPDHKYVITFDVRANDPWIDVTEEYRLGEGSAITWDLSGLKPDTVYHPYTYNARTFRPGGPKEDSTLQPPQHPIATLGPVWRDIWFSGGPYAFVYRKPSVDIPEDADKKEKRRRMKEAASDPTKSIGIGIATVRGSEWRTPKGISKVSQNITIHGDRKKEGRVRATLPTDGGKRRWGLVVGPAGRRNLAGLIRARADVPLNTVLHEWVLEWDSKHPGFNYSFAYQWLGMFNRHMLNPTTFPRNVRSTVGKMVRKGRKVKSRHLAMLAYVFMDQDYWPRPEAEWGNVGNPNFHTDMYNVPLQIAMVMPDHPHAEKWMAFGTKELRNNILRDSYPGGAWAESISYSGFFFHVTDLADKLRKAGGPDLFKQVPRIKQVATYLAAMHTPVDPRYGCRQKAPIGDTHPGHYMGHLKKVAGYYKDVDPKFARDLIGFAGGKKHALEIGSSEFFGFGAMMRGNAYTPRESFVTVKAGPARNHFQGDELSFYFASESTPLAIDYACHYSPRPWSAAAHNRPDMNNKRPAAVACRRAMVTSEQADVFVADERTRRINEVPIEPHEARKPGWEYPWTKLPAEKPWTMRRYTMLVKHGKESRIADYLVVRDEIVSPEPVWWNLHMLARDIDRDGQRFHFPGQLDVDTDVYFIAPEVKKFEKRQWGWKNVKSSKLRTTKGKEYEEKYFGAWLPKDLKRGTWNGGEMAKWLRVRGDAGRSEWLVLIVPRRNGEPAAKVEKLSDTRVKVSLGDESEIITLGSGGKHQAAIERNGKTRVLLQADAVKPLDKVEFKPVRPDIDQGAL